MYFGSSAGGAGRWALPFRSRGGAAPELSAAGAAKHLLGLCLGRSIWLAPRAMRLSLACLRPCELDRVWHLIELNSIEIH